MSSHAKVPPVPLVGDELIAAYRRSVRVGDRRQIPGAVRASAGINTTPGDIDRFLTAVKAIAAGEPSPVAYQQDPTTGDYWSKGDIPGWSGADRTVGVVCPG